MSKVGLAQVLVGLGLIIILIALGLLLYQQRVGIITAAPLPDSLANLSINRYISGSSALVELARLHGQEFQLNKGSVGAYGEGNEIMLYVAGTPLNFIAGRLLVAMRDKLARTDTPFTPVAEKEQGGRTVYEVQGMGQRHFYFRSDDLVIWLAVDDGIAEQALVEVLNFYP